MYAKFWEQVVDWSLRPTESRRLNMTTEYRDGKIRITVDARTDANQPDVHLRLRGGLTPPSRPGVAPPGAPGGGGAPRELRFVQKNSGVYEAEVKAEEAGSYFITAQATRTRTVKGRDGKVREVEEGVDSVRSGVTLPYSPEFADLETNTALLERLRELTDGRAYVDDDQALAEAARSGDLFRPGPGRVKSLLPLWYWLVSLTCVLLFFDVATRRLAVDVKQAATVAQNAWARLRGRPVAEPSREAYVERLQTRPAQAGTRAAQRFEGGWVVGGAPLGADATAPPRPPGPGARPAAQAPEAAPQPEPQGDVFTRLQQAKKRALEERDKDAPQ
jgi:hypothetical protein